MQIIVQNLAVEYLDEGSGNVILLLHGWQDNLTTFDNLVASMTGSFRIVRLDLPGFGKTEIPSSAWNLDNYIQFVCDFVEKLGIKVDVLIGHSFGGRIAMKGIASGKIKAKKLVLIGSAGLAKTRTLRNSIIRSSALIGKLALYIPPLLFWRNALRKRIYKVIGSDYANTGALKDTFVKIISEDLSESAKLIKVPTLLIWGELDIQTTVDDGRKLASLIDGSELKIINEAGHFVHREKTSEVAKYIMEFITEFI